MYCWVQRPGLRMRVLLWKTCMYIESHKMCSLAPHVMIDSKDGWLKCSLLLVLLLLLLLLGGSGR